MNKRKQPPQVRFLRNHPLLKILGRPSRLMTAKFNRRNAVFMTVLSVPAICATALLTLPAFLFNTPEHNEYFEFACQLEESGGRWVALGLSACCSFLCFMMPTGSPDFKKHVG